MFVILAHQRSGTHLLASLLDSHPDLRCYDEVVCTRWKQMADSKPYLGKKEIHRLREKEGCILMYMQFIRIERRRPDLIGFIKKAKIIHLVRESVNNHLMSLCKQRNEEPTPIKLKEHRRMILECRKIVFKHGLKRVFNISYEEICNDKNVSEYENEKLLKFLGVKPYKMTTDYLKGRS
jgi:hypothetical protein